MSRHTKILDKICVVIFIICILCAVLTAHVYNIQPVKYVRIDNYIENIDYGILSPEQILLFDSIINAVDNNELYVDSPILSSREQHEVLTHLGLYYGSLENLHMLICWSDNKAILNLDLFQTLATNKVVIDARIDESVSNLQEGSDQYKLEQISNYISERINYMTGCRDTIQALNGYGVCSSYSMLFYKMATRLGIKTYICFGYAGGYHAWNVVELDGELIFYDITWYDNIIRDNKYVFSETSWNREFQINNIWSADLTNSTKLIGWWLHGKVTKEPNFCVKNKYRIFI